MKKFLFIFLTFILIFNMVLPVLAEKRITLMVNGYECNTDVAPVLDNKRTLIPARAVFEELGATVDWDGFRQCVTIKYNGDEINLYIGQATALVNGYVRELDVPAKIIGDRTMIPLRFVGENFGMQVDWDDATFTVYVNSEANSSQQQFALYSVQVRDTTATTTIEIGRAGESEPSVMELTNPNRLVLDFKGCTLTCGEGPFTSKNPNVKGVRCGQFKSDTARVVVDLDKMVGYDIVRTSYSVVLTLGNETGELTGPGNSMYEEKYYASQPENNQGYVSPVKLSDAARDKLLFIDPGHGGTEVGAIGNLNGNEIYEKNINIRIARLVNEMLTNNGVKTYMLRNGDETIPVSKRPEIANEVGAHFYMSLHNNASETKSVKGVQICYADSTARFSGITNYKIAEIFYDNIASLGLRKAGYINNARYIVIYKANMPSIIVESAFMSNTDDLTLLTNDEFIEKLAQKICDSAIEVMNASANSTIIRPEE